jgi:hypothetical protein
MLSRGSRVLTSFNTERIFSSFLKRLQSTLSPEILRLSNQLKDANAVNAYEDILLKLSQLKAQPEIIEENLTILDQVFSKINQDKSLQKNHKEALHNFVLSNFIEHDPSLSTIHQRHLKQVEGRLSVESLIEIIKYNSGRVSSSWEIFELYYKDLQLSDAERDLLFKAVIDKLVKGDSSDHEDGLFKINQDSLLKALFLSKNLKDVDDVLIQDLFKLAVESESYQLVQLLPFSEALLELLPNLSGDDLAKLFSVWDLSNITENHIKANADVFEKAILSLSDPDVSIDGVSNNELNDLVFALLPRLQSSIPGLTFESPTFASSTKDEIVDNIINKVQNQLKSSEERFTPLRRAVLKAQSINKSSSSNSDELFSSFSQKKSDLSPSETNILAAYYFVLTGNEKFLGELSENEKDIQSLQAYLLSSAYKNVDDALNLYNKVIKNVSRENNELGVSESGLITESLLLAYLSQQDREFAYLIHDGAVLNNIVEGDPALGRLKGIFKRYGEIVGEEEDKIKPLLREEVLKAIKNLI